MTRDREGVTCENPCIFCVSSGDFPGLSHHRRVVGMSSAWADLNNNPNVFCDFFNLPGDRPGVKRCGGVCPFLGDTCTLVGNFGPAGWQCFCVTNPGNPGSP